VNLVLDSGNFRDLAVYLPPRLLLYFHIDVAEIREYHRLAVKEYMHIFSKVGKEGGIEAGV